MNKIEIAKELLEERAANTTDATAFKVNVENDRINLTSDQERRCDLDRTFYHMEIVVDVCRTLHLSSYISTRVRFDEDGKPYSTFEVHIY